MSRNIAASVRDRLLNLAQRNDLNYSRVMTRFGLERLLYRISASPYASLFLLKGALLFSHWYHDRGRPTRDADFLALNPNDVCQLVAMFQEVCAIPGDDGVFFDPTSVQGRDLGIAEKGVVRITLVGDLNRARLTIQIDIGYGDPVSPGPESIAFPTLLEDLPAPRLLAYPKATVVAEKLHAIWSLGMSNTRLKDYYDLDMLLHDGDVDPAQLKEAIRLTFEKRRTLRRPGVPVGLSGRYASDSAKRSLWAGFLKKNGLADSALDDVVKRLATALQRLQVI
ncbi:hypothetical protein CDN99_01500 [Roseateles aquatilis]|uniref:Nucleotidyl transferase AbiEii/AbiGii toxin family protein n=1 Tax=Roseateles aquatilis TaxID=431061 RepID=A0A246JKN4_9BURK|nr:nucleotidyl transferase AbiEii/AbiGii toxin family protein [Roseateles aquatilis]OWQ93198.1 hypothetical protein CDN99_01500 [Roseateles aquatilis]